MIVRRPASIERLQVDTPPLTPGQERVVALLTEFPGMTIRQLAKPLGSSHATATYHLSLLVRKGMLVRERDGREVRHYLAHDGRPTRYLTALARHPAKRAIVTFLASQSTNLSVNKMASQLGLPFGFLKRTLLALDRQGLIRLESRNFRYFVHVQPALRSFSWDA
jgi:predicted ArsR family transcriptional regulator